MNFLLGKWSGETKTFMGPDVPPQMGTIDVEFKEIIDGHFVEQKYSATLDGKPHVGQCIFGKDERSSEATAYWMDSFHTGAAAISFRGPLQDNALSVNGLWYAGDEQWGWRMDLKPGAGKTLELRHFIVTPGGEEALAIEGILKKA
ncbi:MAG: DUF1579 family protein [Bdellovibrionota bacterium]|nr:MAG: DUF1579 domain-containing protein [Pseudomonadota bacterium]